MDFAADAVLEVVAPPPRQSPARAPSHDAPDAPSFEDHLDAATQEADRPVAQRAPQAPAAAQTDSANDQPTAPDAQPSAADAQQASHNVTPPMFVQIVTAAAPEAPGAATQPANASAAAPPVSAPATAGAAPETPAPAPAMTPDIAPAPVESAPAQPAPPPQRNGHSKHDAPPGDKSAAPTAAPASTPTPPASAATGAAPPSPTAPATQATSTPGNAAGEVAPPVLPASPQATSEPSHRLKAVPGRSDAKSEAPAPAAQVTTAAPRTQVKTAAPQTVAKEALALPTVDAPDAAQPQSQPASAPVAAQSSHVQAADAQQTSMRALPAAHQVAREIVRRFEGGATRFELRLDPPELGRVEVRLDVSRDHRVTAVIAADSPQALTELARHARELEQMLQGAGLELGDNGLSFDLRQGGERADAAELSADGSQIAAAHEDQPQVAARPLGYERWRGVRVDMMV